MDYLETLPLDVLRQTALSMDYLDILNLCQQPKFKSICKDQSFWKDKYNIDFKSINNIPDPYYRYQYQYYQEKYKDEITRQIDNDPILNKLTEKREEDRKQLEKYQREKQKLSNQIRNEDYKIDRKVNNKLNSLRKVVLKYRTPFYQEFTIDEEWEIDEIELQDIPGYLYGFRMNMGRNSYIIRYILFMEEGKKNIESDNLADLYTYLINLYPTFEDFKQAYNYPYDEVEMVNEGDFEP